MSKAFLRGVLVLLFSVRPRDRPRVHDRDHDHDVTLAVTMTNDPRANQIQGLRRGHAAALLQTLSTRGKGGVGGNARGVKQYRRR